MILYNWDSAPKCNCGPNFISDLIGKSPIFSAASAASVHSRTMSRTFRCGRKWKPRFLTTVVLISKSRRAGSMDNDIRPVLKLVS